MRKVCVPLLFFQTTGGGGRGTTSTAWLGFDEVRGKRGKRLRDCFSYIYFVGRTVGIIKVYFFKGLPELPLPKNENERSVKF